MISWRSPEAVLFAVSFNERMPRLSLSVSQRCKETCGQEPLPEVRRQRIMAAAASAFIAALPLTLTRSGPRACDRPVARRSRTLRVPRPAMVAGWAAGLAAG